MDPSPQHPAPFRKAAGSVLAWIVICAVGWTGTPAPPAPAQNEIGIPSHTVTLSGKKKKPPRGKSVQPPPAPPASAAGGKKSKSFEHRVRLAHPGKIKPLPKNRLKKEPVEETAGTVRLSGYVREESSWRLHDPEQFSKLMTRSKLVLEGRRSQALAYRVSGRFYYDAAYDHSDTYPKNVRDDMRTQAELNDTFVDLSGGPFEMRLGKQQIVWGEVLGAFVADQVNAKDYREFILPDFDVMRIPDWGIDTEFYQGDFHVEGLWIPAPEMDRLPVKGSEFYPPQLSLPDAVKVHDPVRPAKTPENSEAGGRINGLLGGLDLSAFYLYTWDKSPVYAGSMTGFPWAPSLSVQPYYERLNLMGGTMTYDIDIAVLKGEMVYYNNRGYTVANGKSLPTVVKRDAYDYVAGVDRTWFGKVGTSLQFFVRAIKDAPPGVMGAPDSSMRYLSAYVRSDIIGHSLKGDIFVSAGLNSPDVLLRPSLTWVINGHWKAGVGFNIFGGKPDGVYGQYDKNDSLTSSLEFVF